jgi:hypothetical protein
VLGTIMQDLEAIGQLIVMDPSICLNSREMKVINKFLTFGVLFNGKDFVDLNGVL